MKFLVLILPFVLLLLPGCAKPTEATLAEQTAMAEQLHASAAQNGSNTAAEASSEPEVEAPAATDGTTTSAAETPTPDEPQARKPQPPPADRAPRRPGEAEKITFEDLNLGMQADIVFRPFMLTDRVRELEGKRISIVGYMHGAQESQRRIGAFILLKNTECKFGPGGQADHLANVVLKEGATTKYTSGPIKVEGTLKIEPFQGPTDGNTWYVYQLESAQIR